MCIRDRNVHEACATGDVADSGQQRMPQQEAVVESSLNVPANSLQPTGSRTGDALPQMVHKLATRAVSGAGANFSAAEDPDLDTREDRQQTDAQAQQPPSPAIAHQASVNLATHPCGSSGGRHRAQVPAGLHVEPRGPTLSRVGSVDNLPLEGAMLAAAVAAAAPTAAVGCEGVPPVLLAGGVEHVALQLDARTSGTGCAVMGVHPSGSAAMRSVRQVSQVRTRVS